jgi:hypothetical protein
MKSFHAVSMAALTICFCMLSFTLCAAAQDGGFPALGRIKRANTVAIDCSACPRSLAQAGKVARQQLQAWDRFEIVEDPKQADLVLMFSANPYLGDYLTRKGPDTRPVRIDGVIMTVIDPHTGQELWSDSKRWGSWRVASATKALIEELRGEMEVESKQWTLDDVLRCSETGVYQQFGGLSPGEALAKPELGARPAPDDADRLIVQSSETPDFCKRAQLIVGADGKIHGFEVVTTESDSLDVADVLARADRFAFTSGKDASTQQVYFIAQTRDGKMSIQFIEQGRRAALARVKYLF